MICNILDYLKIHICQLKVPFHGAHHIYVLYIMSLWTRPVCFFNEFLWENKRWQKLHSSCGFFPHNCKWARNPRLYLYFRPHSFGQRKCDLVSSDSTRKEKRKKEKSLSEKRAAGFLVEALMLLICARKSQIGKFFNHRPKLGS